MNNLQVRIRELRKKHGLTQSELAEILRKKYQLKTERAMVSKWETGFQTPEIYTISCIADLFEVSIDYLNGKETAYTNSINSKAIQVVDQKEKNLLHRYRKLNTLGQDKADEYISDLSENPKYKK